jgi:hypothetical protein
VSSSPSPASPRRRRRTAGRPLAALAALAVLAAGCSNSDGAAAGAPSTAGATPTTTPSTTPSPSGAATPGGDATSAYPDYVALGDSYTAAPLVPVADTSNGCLRSSNNYPSLVAAALPGTTLHDASCSGADTRSLTRPQRTGDQPQPPQLGALGPGTDLVTLGMGGNDFNLFATLIGTCAQLRSSAPGGSPCEDQLTAGGVDVLGRDLAKIRDRIAAAVADIRERAPRAKVVVVGYPQTVPSSGSCPALLPLATGDYAYARRINRGLNEALRAGARKADAFVDVFRPSAGHDICADDPWINGAQTDFSRALAYHPFAEEQRAVADLVLARL